MVNPWVRGDGVGYYAYARSLLMDGDLRFENEWLAANPSFLRGRLDAESRLNDRQFTPTGYVDNHFSVGPSLLWAPFLVAAHMAVLTANSLGAVLPADGYSWPYTVTMAVATAGYGFLGLLLSFRLAHKYFAERWAFLATLGIWFASSLPVYMYFNPSWGHAHSAFVVALFLWYWHRTRPERSARQWLLLGLIAGLMMDVYYPNAVFLLVPLLESLRKYARIPRPPAFLSTVRLLRDNTLFLVATFVAFLPTVVTRQILYGHPFEFGYGSLNDWNWTRPALAAVLFSSNHGLLTWTPILVPALLGLLWWRRRDPEFATSAFAASLTFYYLIASWHTWHGLSSFGNRFFVSLTPIFVLGLAAAGDALERALGDRTRAVVLAGALLGLLAVWNAGFIFQWGTNLIPNRGPISWRQMAYNQVYVVPTRLAATLKRYLGDRHALMENLEAEDLRELQERRNGK